MVELWSQGRLAKSENKEKQICHLFWVRRMREIDIEALAGDAIKQRWPGAMFIKTNPRKDGRGTPDRLVRLPGDIKLYLEFKRPGSRMSDEQFCKYLELRKRGDQVYVCESIEAALYFCELAIQDHRNKK
jgi:hypothetical protein